MEGTKLRNIVLYYLLYAIKELGINLPLLFRRITETAAKDIEYISKEFYGGKMSVTDLSQAAKDWCNMLKQEKLVEDISIEFKDNFTRKAKPFFGNFSCLFIRNILGFLDGV